MNQFEELRARQGRNYGCGVVALLVLFSPFIIMLMAFTAGLLLMFVAAFGAGYLIIVEELVAGGAEATITAIATPEVAVASLLVLAVILVSLLVVADRIVPSALQARPAGMSRP